MVTSLHYSSFPFVISFVCMFESDKDFFLFVAMSRIAVFCCFCWKTSNKIHKHQKGHLDSRNESEMKTVIGILRVVNFKRKLKYMFFLFS